MTGSSVVAAARSLTILSPDTLWRFFGGIKYHLTTEMLKALIRISLDVMQPILLDHALDLVSMAFCRYGEQASA